jgi:hypothetical protein
MFFFPDRRIRLKILHIHDFTTVHKVHENESCIFTFEAVNFEFVEFFCII